MADRRGEFSFFKGSHVKIDLSISIKLMATKFDKQVHLQELIDPNKTNQAGAGDVIKSRSPDKLKSLNLY